MTNFQPAGYTTVAPWVATDDTGHLLDFVTAVFGGVESGRVPLENGSIGHAEIRVGDTVLLAFDRPEGWPVMPSLLRVWVPDVDATMERATAAGATVVTQPVDHAFGQRGGRFLDPFGNIWWIDTKVEDIDPDTALARFAEPRYADAMRYAQESLDRMLTGRQRAVSPPSGEGGQTEAVRNRSAGGS